jgi:uncharacterized protein (TIGR02145 family)
MFCATLVSAQSVEITGFAKISNMDTVSTGETVVVRKPDGTLAERSNMLRVSLSGDTLYNGTNWVIVPGISLANYPYEFLPIDGDSNLYDIVSICDQIWFAENLRTTKYNDLSPIPLVMDNSEWGNLTSPGYCWYNNDSTSNAIPYGALYNYYAVADTASKNVCPLGWHVPSDAELTILINCLDGMDVAGGKMKEVGTTHWEPPNTGATNSSGFTAVAAGNRNTSGVFDEFGLGAFFWSSTQHDANRAYFRHLGHNTDDAVRHDNLKDIGFSVRCVKD